MPTPGIITRVTIDDVEFEPAGRVLLVGATMDISTPQSIKFSLVDDPASDPPLQFCQTPWDHEYEQRCIENLNTKYGAGSELATAAIGFLKSYREDRERAQAASNSRSWGRWALSDVMIEGPVFSRSPCDCPDCTDGYDDDEDLVANSLNTEYDLHEAREEYRCSMCTLEYCDDCLEGLCQCPHDDGGVTDAQHVTHDDLDGDLQVQEDPDELQRRSDSAPERRGS